MMVLHTGPLRSSQVIGFEIYLYEMNRAGSPICAYCRAAIDIAKHTFLFCFSWAKEKEALFGVFDLGSVNRSYLDSENHCGSPSKWIASSDFASP